MASPLFKFLSLALLLLFGYGADYASKRWAEDALKERAPIPVVEGFFELRYAENRAIAFSMLHDVPENIRTPLIFTLSSVATLFILFVFWSWRRRGFLDLLPFALILSGAFGNLHDRIKNGYVIDFFHVYYQRWSYPIFNIADSLVCVGVGLLIWRGILEERAVRRQRVREEERQAAASASAAGAGVGAGAGTSTGAAEMERAEGASASTERLGDATERSS